MPDIPLVSIIVPNYNHAKFLAKRMDSIMNQTYKNYELVLMDDCSTDNSLDILRTYENHPSVHKLLINDENSGTSYKQWYEGIKHTRGELIWIAESDDWCEPEFLEFLVPQFDDKNLSLAFTESIYIYNSEDENIEPAINKCEVFEGKDFIKAKMLEGNGIVNASAVLFRKETYMSVMDKGFTDLKFCGDWLLWMQIMQSHRVAYFPSTMNFLRRHSENATNYFRAKGLDFLEGLKVLKTGKSMVNYDYNKNIIFRSWLNRFMTYKKHYSFRIRLKVISGLFIREPGMGMYILFEFFKTSIKRRIHSHKLNCI